MPVPTKPIISYERLGLTPEFHALLCDQCHPAEYNRELAEQACLLWPDKFTVSDVVGYPVLMRETYAYAARYTGTLDFMRDMKGKDWLSPPQMRGVMNCMRAEVLYRQKQKPTQAALIQGVPTTIDMRPVAQGEGERIPDGRFTVVFSESKGDHITLRIKTKDERSFTSSSLPDGTQIAEYLFGPDNGVNYKGFAFIFPDGSYRVWKSHKDSTRLIQALDILLLGGREKALQAGERYALESGSCFVCGRPLTVPASIGRGMGPRCFEKVLGEALPGEWED